MGQRANLSHRRKGLSVQSTGRRCKPEVSSGWREREGGGGLVNSVVATWFIHVLYVGGELWVCVCVCVCVGGGGAWLVYMYWWEITVKMCESQLIN